MPISLKDEIIKFYELERVTCRKTPQNVKKMFSFYQNLLNMNGKLKFEGSFIDNNYKKFKNNEFYSSFMVNNIKFINSAEPNINNIIRDIILYNEQNEFYKFIGCSTGSRDVSKEEIKKFLKNSKKINIPYYEEEIKIEDEIFIFKMKPEIILENGYNDSDIDIALMAFMFNKDILNSVPKNSRGSIYKIQIIKKGNEPKPKKPKNKKNKLSPKIEIIEEPIIITDDEATHEEPFIMTDDETTQEEQFIINDDETTQEETIIINDNETTHEDPFIITDDETTQEETIIITDDKSDDISLLSDITDDNFILYEDTKELNKIIDITFNKRQNINNNEQIYIKEILFNLIESNKKFQNIINGYNTITVLRGIHHDKNLLDISKHFNGYLFNTLNNKRSNTFHFYIYNDKVCNITELNNII
jgi:hypothetical protein